MFTNDNKQVPIDSQKIAKQSEDVMGVMFDSISESFCPVIFLGEDSYLNNPSPVTESLRTLSTWNAVVSTAEFPSCVYPLKNDTSKLYRLSYTEEAVTVYLIRQKVLSDAFGSFIAALDQGLCERKNLLHYFYIREAVRDNLFGMGSIPDLYMEITHLIHDSVICFTSHNVYSDENMEAQKAFLLNAAGLLSSTIISAINCGIENAVNDIMYRVHTNPNQNDLERKMRQAFNLDMRVEEGFWIYAADCLKSAIMRDVEICYPIITSVCRDTLMDIMYTNCYVYRDFAKDCANMKQKQIENNCKDNL